MIEKEARVKNGGGKSLIVGLGKTGLSCARFLAALGMPVAVTDTRERPPFLDQLRAEFPDTALFLGGFDPAAFAAADRLVVSPGVSVKEPLIRMAAERGVPVVGDIELFAQNVGAPVAVVTGSNGKSTVTTLLGRMAEAAGRRVKVGGNLGEPALDLLDDRAELYVLELSSFQLETTRSLRPAAAVVLNVSADHLDRYASLEEYTAVKRTAYRDAQAAVFNKDDPLVLEMSRSAARPLFFTLGEPLAGEFGLRRIDGEAWLCHGEERILPSTAVRTPGSHNIANALAALAMGHALGFSKASMAEALKLFTGLPHRTQLVTERDGVRWYNDSKGTNVGACIAALEGLHDLAPEGRTVLIAGGQGKGADFSPLKPVVERTCRAVVLIGEDAPLLERALAGGTPLLRAESMEQAVRLAKERALRGDRVLLYPACASFDMFNNYAHRGEMFVEAVGRMVP